MKRKHVDPLRYDFWDAIRSERAQRVVRTLQEVNQRATIVCPRSGAPFRGRPGSSSA